MDGNVEVKARSVPEVAREIRRQWKNIYFGAVPYLEAMMYASYGLDGEKSVVLYFLANAQTFRGPDAKRLKAELKKIVGVK